MSSLTPAQLRALAEKATEGPWFDIRLGPEVGANPYQYLVSCTWPDLICVCEIDRALTATEDEAKANAAFIAAANPAAIIELIDSHDAQVAKLEQECETWTNRYDDAEGRCKILTETNEGLLDDLAGARAALLTHGKHGSDCNLHQSFETDPGYCSCGLSQALRAHLDGGQARKEG